MNELFANPSTCSSIWFPSQLEELTRQIPGQVYTSEELIQNHTLIPYFTPFIPHERATRLMELVKSKISSSANMILGRAALSVKPKQKLLYCSECVQEDRTKYGEAYWHRCHQLEGVYVCTEHGSFLIQSRISHQVQGNRYQFFTLENVLVDTDEKCSIIDYSCEKYYKYIAVQSLYLLNKQLPSVGLNKIHTYYVSKLRSEGYVCRASNRIKWDRLISAFRFHYGDRLLTELNGMVRERDSWLHKLLRKPRVSCHPLRHILLLGFLGETVESMMDGLAEEKTINYEPFGHGPWPCLNKAANHYRQPVIVSCKITRCSRSGNPVGTFTCDCGFIYSRTGPDKADTDRFKIGRIKAFGSVWRMRHAELSLQKLSLRRQAELLGCDPQTIINQQRRMI
ncbi:TnsD family Tn7-like transposition protein [Paenibacillus sp. FSL K6-2524]|uniref:TnsD family Tn7-like transposition protein n=1 Tax=Paenibacillus sp. FSL K6-2524 TaxID=2954516 RepID=UPI0030FB51D2